MAEATLRRALVRLADQGRRVAALGEARIGLGLWLRFGLGFRVGLRVDDYWPPDKGPGRHATDIGRQIGPASYSCQRRRGLDEGKQQRGKNCEGAHGILLSE